SDSSYSHPYSARTLPWDTPVQQMHKGVPSQTDESRLLRYVSACFPPGDAHNRRVTSNDCGSVDFDLARTPPYETVTFRTISWLFLTPVTRERTRIERGYTAFRPRGRIRRGAGDSIIDVDPVRSRTNAGPVVGGKLLLA